jgi:hypothetical protein
VDFSEAKDLFGIIFQIPGPNYKIMDCGLISKKSRGLSAKCQKLEFPGIIFLKGEGNLTAVEEKGRGDGGEPNRLQEGAAEGRT